MRRGGWRGLGGGVVGGGKGDKGLEAGNGSPKVGGQGGGEGDEGGEKGGFMGVGKDGNWISRKNFVKG